MRDLHFGIPGHEEEHILVIAPKAECSSLDEFVLSALAFLDEKAEDEYDAHYWSEHYQGCPLVDVEQFRSRWELSGCDYSVDEENKPVQVIIEPILHAFRIGPQSWNEVTWCLETEEDYIFYTWNTTA